MKDLTLIGEYIGSPYHQHLVKYSRISLIFYAIVQNSSNAICWPCNKAWSFFKEFNLDVVNITSLGCFANYDSLCDNLETTFKKVSKSSISEDEEGNVLYFVKDEGEVLSIAKLKTLEYRLFRKMREKLRNFYGVNRNNKYASNDFSLKKFKNKT